jgi:hypothetical protein
MVIIVVSLTSSEYHYSSFSKLLDLHYFKNLSISAPIFSKKKPLFLNGFVAKTFFCGAKTKPRLAFPEKRLTDFSANTLL